MKIVATFVVAWIGFCSFSFADFQITNSRGEFLSILQDSYYLETFDNLATGTVQSPPPFSSNGFSYTVRATGDNLNGNLFVIGASDKWLSTELERSVRFDFTATHPKAFGGDFFFTNFNGVASGDLGSTMLFTLNGTSQFSMPANLVATNSFIGFYGDSQITSIVVSRSGNPLNSTSYITANNTIAGITAVPEPGLLSMLCLPILMWCSRRKLRN